ncbi:hypothetical protein MMC11_007277 [Xylographa trunciseda]|nr:hypothetical protein [Xylographa trunciseda]
MASRTPKRKRGKTDVGRDGKILVAVDFGTTFSGVAWVHSSQPNIRNTIIQWPNAISEGLEGITKPKVPTELQYVGSKIGWGYKISDSAPRHKWFKLSLDPTQERNLFSLEPELPDAYPSASSHHVTVEKMVIDYLTALRQHVEQVLQYKVPKDTLARTPLQYCLTVPAVWSETAQAKTHACAVAAGMTKDEELTMITEPEAAATYALDAMNPHHLKVGSVFVLVDAGGGTVDLISYKVIALKPILKVKEAAPGTGALCGSTYINRLFKAFLSRKLGNDPMWDDEVLQEAMTTFETFTKGSYQGRSTEAYTIPVSGLADNAALGIRRGKLTVTGADLEGIFQPVIAEIITLVKGQVRATRPTVPQAILLVGGFGQSSYLRECIRKAVSSSDIDVMQSPNGYVMPFSEERVVDLANNVEKKLQLSLTSQYRWTAVVEGALMRILSQHAPLSIRVDISERRARKHYGLYICTRFDDKEHDIQKRFWHAYLGAFRIEVMEWFVNKGDAIKEREPKHLSYSQQKLVARGHPQQVTMTVYFCTDPDDSGAPLYCISNVKELVKVTADLSKVPISAFPISQGQDGKAYYSIEFQIEITYHSACTKYELIHGGKNYGQVTAEQV